MAFVVSVLTSACISTSPAPGPTIPSSPAWPTYHDPVLGYSIAYPPGWVEADDSGTDVRKHYFANAPLDDYAISSALGDGVMVVAVLVFAFDDRCLESTYSNSAFPPINTSIDGQTATVSGSDLPTLALFDALVRVGKNKRCFSFGTYASSREARDLSVPTFLKMLSTFKFATAPS
jgi:hypothetical protein